MKQFETIETISADEIFFKRKWTISLWKNAQFTIRPNAF